MAPTRSGEGCPIRADWTSKDHPNTLFSIARWVPLSKICHLTALPIKKKTGNYSKPTCTIGSVVSQGLFYPANFLNLLRSPTRVILGMHLHNTHPHYQTQLLDSPLALSLSLYAQTQTHTYTHAYQLKLRNTQCWRDTNEGSNVLWDYVIFCSSSRWAMIWGRTHQRSSL